MARARKAAGRPSASERKSSPESLTLDREAVRHWRLQRGWTQEVLSQQSVELDGQLQTLSYAQIRRIESDGRCGPTSARILAELLAVPLAKLAPRDHLHLPCGLLREPSADFVGRENEIKSVLAALEGRGSVRIAASIEGLPGIGKTELALQVVGQCERERRFRVFWFDAEQPDLTRTWADVVAPHLEIEHEDPGKRAAAALRAIESLAEPVLLVLDNVEEWSASRPWPRPRGRHIHWLVTTRRNDLGGREFHHIDVPVLEREAAERLMTQIAGPEVATRPGYSALQDLLGGYTIAVELAATFLRRFPEVDPEEYCRELGQGRSEELAEEVGDRTLYGQTLERALELLWDRLSPRVRGHWQLAAEFAQAPATPDLSDACGLDRRARAALRDYHLIETHSSRGWSMHRLIRDFGRRNGSRETTATAERAFCSGCLERSRGMNWDDGFKLYRPDRDHFDSALAMARRVYGKGSAEGAELCDGVASAHISLSQFGTAIALLDQTLHELEADRAGPDQRDRLVAGLALALGRSGEAHRARGLLEQTISRAILRLGGEDHEIVQELRGVLGQTLTGLGEWREARVLSEAVLSSVVRTLGSRHPNVAGVRSNLAVILRRLGDLDAARELLETAIAECPGQEDSLIGSFRSNLGLVLWELGELSSAKGELELALESAIQHFGDEHPRVGVRQTNLGVVHHAMGDLVRARELHERALASYLALGAEHPQVALGQRNLAWVLHSLGSFEQAKALYAQALDSDVRNLGESHPDVARRQSLRAEVLRDLDEIDAARELSERALEHTVAALGEEHPNTALCRSNLGLLLVEVGELARAKELLEAASRSYEARGRPNRPDRAKAQFRLARAHSAEGKLEETVRLLERAIATLAEERDPGHYELTPMRADLARALRELGDLAGARAQLELALEADRSGGRAEHPEGALVRARLADLLRRSGEALDRERARSLACEAHALARQQPGGWYRRAEVEALCEPILRTEGIAGG